MTVQIGQGYIDITANDAGLRREVSAAIQQAQAGQEIVIPVEIREMDFTRQSRRVGNMRRRLLASATSLGRSFGSVLGGSAYTSFAREFRSGLNVFGTGGLGGIGQMATKIAGLAAAISPLIVALVALIGHLGLALTSLTAIAPAALGAAAALGGLYLAFTSLESVTTTAGTAFTAELQNWKSELTGLQRIAQESILPGFTDLLIDLRTLLPQVSGYIASMGEQMGRAASELGTYMASDAFSERLTNIMWENEKASIAFADSAAPIVQILTNISEAAAPLVTRFAEAWAAGAQHLALMTEMGRESGALAGFFEKSGDAMATWWNMLGDFAVGLINVFRAGYAAGDQMAVSMEQAAARFREWSGSDVGQEKMRSFFEFFVSLDYGHILQVASSVLAVGAALKGVAAVEGLVSFVAMIAGLSGLAATVAAVAGVVAVLAGALVYLYMTSEPVREIIDSIGRSFMENIWPSLEKVSSFIRNDVAPVLSGLLKSALEWYEDFFTNHLFPAISEMIDNLLPMLRNAWETLTSAFDQNSSQINTVFEAFKTISGFIVDNILPIIGTLAGVIVNVLVYAITGLITIIGGLVTAAEWLAGVFRTVWSVIYDYVSEKIRTLREAFTNFSSNVKGVFSGLWSNIKDGWTNFTNWLGSKVDSFTSKFKNAWTSMKDGVVSVIKNLPSAAVAGVNKLIDMINSMIGKVNNVLPSSLEIGKLKHVAVSGYAQGGLIRGPGTGTSDSVPIYGSDGEFVLRARAVSALAGQFGRGFLGWLNHYDHYGDAGGLGIRRYASGGLITRTQNFIKSTDPLPYVFGNVGPNSYDCSGLVGEVWARLKGKPSYRRYFNTALLAGQPGSYGFRKGLGTYTIGLSNGHVVGNLAGLQFEAASSKSGIKVGSSAKSVTRMPSQLYLASLGDNYMGDTGGVIADLVADAVDNILGPLRDKLSGALSGQPEMVSKLALGTLDRAANGLKKIPFDTGGWLQPGLTLAENNTGRPERVIGPNDSYGDTYQFAAGSIVLDASRIRSMQDLTDLIDGLKTSARTVGAMRDVEVAV